MFAPRPLEHDPNVPSQECAIVGSDGDGLSMASLYVIRNQGACFFLNGRVAACCLTAVGKLMSELLRRLSLMRVRLQSTGYFHALKYAFSRRHKGVIVLEGRSRSVLRHQPRTSGQEDRLAQAGRHQELDLRRRVVNCLVVRV
jgi:hypothetical protein